MPMLSPPLHCVCTPSQPLRLRLATACPALLLAAALAGCNPQPAAAEKAASAPAAPAASVAPQAASAVVLPASVPASAASAAEPPASAASEAAQPASALPPAFTTPQEEAALKRAQERWDALLERDFARAWTYLETAERGKVAQQDYAKAFGNDAAWKEATARRARCLPERCAVFVRLTMEVLASQFKREIPEVTMHFHEEWVLEDGKWHYRGMANQVTREEKDVKGEWLPSAADPEQPREPRKPGMGSVAGP